MIKGSEQNVYLPNLRQKKIENIKMLIKKRKWITKMCDYKVKIHDRKRSPNTSITTINVNAVNSLKIRVIQPPLPFSKKKAKSNYSAPSIRTGFGDYIFYLVKSFVCIFSS